jgi:hypothetical protein
MRKIALVLRLLSAAIWAIVLVGAGLKLGFNSKVLFFVFWICFSLIPHSVLFKYRLLVGTIFTISLLPLLWMLYLLLTLKSRGADYAATLPAGVAFGVLLALLPASIMISFFAFRIAPTTNVTSDAA